MEEMADGVRDRGISMLPSEILSIIFDIVSPNVVFEKFIKPYSWTSWNNAQEIAYKSVFSKKLIVQSHHTMNGYNPSKIFYSKADFDSAFVIIGFDRAYAILRHWIYFNMETSHYVIPEEIGMLFNFTNSFPGVSNCSRLLKEIESFTRLLKVLSFDNYYKGYMPKVCFQLVYDIDMTPELMLKSRKVMQSIEDLGSKTHKLLIINRFNSKTQVNTFHPSNSENLQELYLWNNAITDFSIKHYLRAAPPVLKILDLSANAITSLRDLSLPTSLEKLFIGANNLGSLVGPDYVNCVNLHTLDAAINAITGLDGIEFPKSLKTLRLSYNEISRFHNEELPPNLESLALSRNMIKSFDESFVLPSTVKELQLNANGIVYLPQFFFAAANQLKILNLSDNKIDDLDDLGRLPNSLQELTLDNNEIDYSNYSNIFTDSLTKLSMKSTGLVDVSNIRFPPTLELLNLSGNEISIFKDVKFNLEDWKYKSDDASPTLLQRLDLSSNKLTTFNLPEDNIEIPSQLKYLNLSHNLFHGIDSIRLPPNLTHLILKDVSLGSLSNDIISKLPKTLVELKLDHTNWSSTSSRPYKPCQDNRSIDMEESGTGIVTNLCIDFEASLPRLEVLTLDNNDISSIKDVKYPSTLTHLSYEHNHISRIELENVPTNIKYLQLNENLFRLKEFRGNQILYTLEGEKEDLVQAIHLPYFPNIEFFGLCGDQTTLMKSGLFYGVT